MQVTFASPSGFARSTRLDRPQGERQNQRVADAGFGRRGRWAEGLAPALSTLVLALTLMACAQAPPIVTRGVLAGVDLEDFETFYIPTHGSDRKIHEAIRDELVLRGRTATFGTDPKPPDGTDVVVIYEDRWSWDLDMYLMILKIDFRDPGANLLLATGASNRSSLSRAPTGEMVGEVLSAIFEGSAAKESE